MCQGRFCSGVGCQYGEIVRAILVQMLTLFHFLASDGLSIDGTPTIEDISQHKGDEERDEKHNLQSGYTGARIGKM